MSYNRRYSNHRRSNSNLGSVVSDAATIANAFGPKGAVITGLIGFGFFYFTMPWLLMEWENDSKARMVGPLAALSGKMLDEIFFRRFIHPCEWAGIAILITCVTIACWKACTDTELDRYSQQQLSSIAKLFARFLDR